MLGEGEAPSHPKTLLFQLLWSSYPVPTVPSVPSATPSCFCARCPQCHHPACDTPSYFCGCMRGPSSPKAPGTGAPGREFPPPELCHAHPHGQGGVTVPRAEGTTPGLLHAVRAEVTPSIWGQTAAASPSPRSGDEFVAQHEAVSLSPEATECDKNQPPPFVPKPSPKPKRRRERENPAPKLIPRGCRRGGPWPGAMPGPRAAPGRL